MLKNIFKNIYFSQDNGAGADGPNEGNLGPSDSFGFDENDKD